MRADDAQRLHSNSQWNVTRSSKTRNPMLKLDLATEGRVLLALKLFCKSLGVREHQRESLGQGIFTKRIILLLQLLPFTSSVSGFNGVQIVPILTRLQSMYIRSSVLSIQ